MSDTSELPTGPLIPRMVLGQRLRRLREAAGISLDDAGETIRASGSKICRMELGRTGFKQRDVADLLTRYGVDDEGERAIALALAEQSNAAPWWYGYRSLVPDWLRAYLNAEQAASVIRCFETRFIPPLLQTEDYARQAIRHYYRDASEGELARRLQLRMGRRRILYRKPDPTQLWVVLDESVLHRRLGDTGTMRAQLEHLIEMCELPNVTVQVVPFSVGGHSGTGGSATLVRFPQQGLPDMVYVRHLAGASYPDKPADVDRYWHSFNILVTEAATPDDTLEIIRRILARY
ncbi:transcriptional regulator [Actinomadura craniellae]|uniref:Transcriptional regulator n=1 Tax=Actinomadura craniellae TaxID=2231787 RepID=A0A365H433_9ACTN|nr:helix-turn-helix transcriptional regulator [Actinomadura craniellae]RAY13851.1 transcriptional regulator [Actinomadura craniellae]